MLTLRVETVSGGIYTIVNATAFGPDAVIGNTPSDPTTDRIFHFAESDVVTMVSKA